jgi:hypothetical protein
VFHSLERLFGAARGAIRFSAARIIMSFELHTLRRYPTPTPAIDHKAFRRTSLATLCLAVVTILCPATWGQSLVPGHHPRVLNAVIRPNGTYQLSFAPTGWVLIGVLPQPSAKIVSSTGKDAIGPYHEVTAAYLNGAKAAQIRTYDDRPIAVFRDTWNVKGPNQHPFPTFTELPSKLMRFSYQQTTFGVYQFGSLGPEGPWTLFDEHHNTVVLSPADQFQISRMNLNNDGTAESRVLDTIETLPSGFSHSTIVAFGAGVNEAFAVWGDALLKLGGKARPKNDAGPMLSKLGYWTDNGATYYYKFEPQLGYEETLRSKRQELLKMGIPLGYLQLDSWWYPKGPDARWDAAGSVLPAGAYLYRADESLFPGGLAAFQRSLGVPIATHARWISSASPYRQQYKMSGNVVIDPVFWNLTAEYLQKAGVVTYEQDWLDHNAQTEFNLRDPNAFLSNMATAMRSHGISIQYCMPLPSHYMASTQFSNVETIRPSNDRLKRNRWDAFLYDSRLASALGLWPWSDVFFSDELPNLILSNLSAGPVGVGDGIGSTNARNLLRAVRADGTIIKPDTTLIPIDAMYATDTKSPQDAMVATATTQFGQSRVLYVFSYPRRPTDTDVTIPLRSLGVSSPVYAFDWVTRQGAVLPPSGMLRMTFVDGWSYQVLSPVSPEGFALLGDSEKIVPLGKKRIRSISDKGLITVTIQYAARETARPISGYCAHEPRVRMTIGKVAALRYDNQTHIFTADVSPGANGIAKMVIDPRR